MMGITIAGYSYFTVMMSQKKMKGWQFWTIRNGVGSEDVVWRAQRE